jgi:hypothetical protein
MAGSDHVVFREQKLVALEYADSREWTKFRRIQDVVSGAGSRRHSVLDVGGRVPA